MPLLTRNKEWKESILRAQSGVCACACVVLCVWWLFVNICVLHANVERTYWQELKSYSNPLKHGGEIATLHTVVKYHCPVLVKHSFNILS